VEPTRFQLVLFGTVPGRTFNKVPLEKMQMEVFGIVILIGVILFILIICTKPQPQKGSFTDHRDSKTYKTVKIGNQTWLAENLNYEAEGSKCYDNNPANGQKYGRLYNWETAKKACPPGWHLPSDKEWSELQGFTGNVKKLQAAEWNGTDNFGFAALPGGYGYSNGSGSGVGESGYWWRVSEGNASDTYFRIMNYCHVDEFSLNFGEGRLCSVRCVQDQVVANKMTFTDSRDGKTYKKVKIGNQTWMAENLAYEAEGSKCYDNNLANGQKYGRLYNWETAKKACPPGWHLPSDAEWDVLMTAVGGSSTAGIKLKAASGWSGNGNGTDEFGFSALPGGNGNSNGDFNNVGNRGYWWSATEDGAADAWYRIMGHYYATVYRNNNVKTRLFSVRCVQD
jgi:uncharacterized protein (TIGR02145 family)